MAMRDLDQKAAPVDSMNVRHCKDVFQHKSKRSFNTQVGDLFHTGMGMRDPKTDWKEPAHDADPHKSHDVFCDKKVKHQTGHNTVRGNPSYDPKDTHGRTLDVGRPVGRGHTAGPARPHPDRPASSPASSGRRPGSAGSPQSPKYTSHQELVVNKRRHMTDLDCRQTAPSAYSSRSPRSPGGRPSSSNGSVGSHAGERGGHGGHARCNMKTAGVPSGGTKDLKRMEPVHQGTPHKSLYEFSLKKQQHFAPIHTTANDPRFYV